MTHGLRTHIAARAVAAAMLVTLPVTVNAQTRAPHQNRAWTIEVFGGAGFTLDTIGGETTVEFPVGEPFATRDGLPSRRVSSWQFGDGASLFNTVLQRFGAIQGVIFPPIAALDAALRGVVTTQRRGTSAGLRVGRHVTSRLSVDIAVEHRRMPLGFTDAFQGAALQTSQSFRTSFHKLLSTAPISELAVTSSRTLAGGSNHQTRVGGALRWTLFAHRQVSGFVAAGAGIDISGGGSPSVTLTGRYAGRLNRAVPFEETDTVTVVASHPRMAAVGTAALGVTWRLGHRLGLRADATFSATGGARTVTVHATPSRVSGALSGVMPSLTTPAIQFSTTAAHPTSLSGPAVAMTTFRSRGLHQQVSFSLGVFRRF